MLAAAWIQFQVHDWVNHERHDLREDGKDKAIVLPRRGLPPWQNHKDWPAEHDMRIAENKVMATAPGGYPVFANSRHALVGRLGGVRRGREEGRGAARGCPDPPR